jgi:hypothetical protein
MQKRGGSDFNTVSGRGRKYDHNIDMVSSIQIIDQDKNIEPFKERVHLWNTIKVSLLIF